MNDKSNAGDIPALTTKLAGLCAVLLITLVALALSAPQAVRADGPIYVDKDAPGPIHDGTSWTTAFTHPQTALDSAAPSDEIWVAEGIYTPTHMLTDGPSFYLNNVVALYGGFGGYGISETQRTDRDWDAHLTILSGDLGSDDVTDPNGIVTDTGNINGTNAAHVVYSPYSITIGTLLDGFVITAGRGGTSGGGVLNYGDPYLLHLTIIGNQATNGGGVANYGMPMMGNLTITGNQADNGGGLYNESDDLLSLSYALFDQNRALSGGGLFNSATSYSLLLDSVTFDDNEATQNGGGMMNASLGVLTNVTFENNRAGNGGGVYIAGSTYLSGTTLISNTATTYGGGIYNDSHDDVELNDSILEGNTAQDGGGLYQDESQIASLYNVSFTGNTADGDGGGLYIDPFAYSIHTTVEGVTFTQNYAGYDGGGLYTGAAYVLDGGMFSNNEAGYNGGGMLAENDTSLANVTFIENDAFNEGGGLYLIAGLLHLNNAAFRGNAALLGGGLSIYGEELDVNNIVFSGNSAYHGGGLYLNLLNGTFTNLSVFDNVAYTGGGAYIVSGSNSFANSTFWNNQSDAQGAQIYLDGGNTTLDYNLVQDGCPTGVVCAHILDVDPMVVRPPDPGDGDWGTRSDNDYGNLRLRPHSPAINAGDSARVTQSIDLDGSPRIMGDAVDLGAYEVEIYMLEAPSPSTLYDFAPNVCGSIVFSDTGTLPTSLTITLTHAAPTANADGLARRYDIRAAGSSDYSAILTLCYEDDELAPAGIPLGQESDLHLYRWDQGSSAWLQHSEVNTVTNRISAGGITEFGVWGIGTPSTHPTAVHLRSATAQNGIVYAGLLLLGLLTLFIITRRPKTHNPQAKA